VIQRTAVLDTSVIEVAIREALRSRGLALGTFPPADPRNRATSVLESALSKELQEAGLTVMTTATLVDEAFGAVERQLPQAVQELKRIEDALWEQFAEAIDTQAIDEDSADASSPLGPWTAEAVRVHDADVLVTARAGHLELAHALGGLLVLGPDAWLVLADSEIRKHRLG
jgi:hypothetical protein